MLTSEPFVLDRLYLGPPLSSQLLTYTFDSDVNLWDGHSSLLTNEDLAPFSRHAIPLGSGTFVATIACELFHFLFISTDFKDPKVKLGNSWSNPWSHNGGIFCITRFTSVGC